MKKISVLRQVILGVSLAAIPVLIAAPALSLASDRTLGETVEDAMLATKVKAALLTDLGFDAMGIDVTARSGAVILEGTVDKRTTAEQSEPVAQAVDGVTSVTHRVKVEPALPRRRSATRLAMASVRSPTLFSSPGSRWLC